MELNKLAILMLALSISSTYCTQDNGIERNIELRDSSTVESHQLSQIVQDTSNIFKVDDTNGYGIIDAQNAQLILFSEEQLGNIINNILEQTYNDIKSAGDAKSKINCAEPFYKILYHPHKLSFTLKKENVNTFNNINNITSELEPLCKEHAIANTCKDTLYGLDKLAASLPTINEQFINGYNFQIDFTKLYGVNKDKFKEHYRDMLYTVPATKNCLNFKNIELLLQVLDLHIKI